MSGDSLENPSWVQSEAKRQPRNGDQSIIVDRGVELSWRALVKMRGPRAKDPPFKLEGGHNDAQFDHDQSTYLHMEILGT